MPVKRAAYKALRQNRLARPRNLTVTTKLKKLNIQLRQALTAKQADQAKTIAQQFVSALDRAAEKKIVHRNQAARKKSRVLASLKRLAA